MGRESILQWINKRAFSLFLLIADVYLVFCKQWAYCWNGNLAPRVPFPLNLIPVVSEWPMPFLPGAPIPAYQWIAGMLVWSGMVAVTCFFGIPRGNEHWPGRSATFGAGLALLFFFGFTMWY